MKIANMGAGCLGSYVGGWLAQITPGVTFITRGNQLQDLRQSGLRIESHIGDFHPPSVKATDDCQGMGTVDLVLLCVKSYDSADAIEQMKPMVGTQTVVIPAQNGIEHIKTLNNALRLSNILGATCIISAHISPPGHVKQIGPEHEFAFGELDGSFSQRCQAKGVIPPVNDAIHACALYSDGVSR